MYFTFRAQLSFISHISSAQWAHAASGYSIREIRNDPECEYINYFNLRKSQADLRKLADCGDCVCGPPGCADGAGEAMIRQRAFTRTHLANQTSGRNGTLLPPVHIHSPSDGPGGLSKPLVTIRGSQVPASTFYSLFPISAPHGFSASWFLILVLLPRPPPALRHFPSRGNSCSSSDPTGSDPVAMSPGSGTSLGWCAPSL